MSGILEVVIVGGGTAGWMCAAALAGAVGPKICKVTLIESDEIATVGVGEATIPAIKEFNDYIGVIESEMMQHTNATFKLGIEFVDWGFKGSSYIHPFGTFGDSYGGVEFIHHWNRLRQRNQVGSIEDYSYAVQACRNNRFEFAVRNADEINSTYSHAYHFDANLYAKFLREFAEKRGLRRIEGKIVTVGQDDSSGNVTEVVLASGEKITGDLFIDCSGFRSLLLGDCLDVPFEDWSKWLVCDRAWAVPTSKLPSIPPYTQATARAAGWQWKIPLQHRTGNGVVYCSEYISDDEACADLLANIGGKPVADPRLIRFKAGRRKKSWVKNCVGVGLSAGFLEPLESTSIYLIQIAIVNLIKFLPVGGMRDIEVDEFNRLVDLEYDRVRDFLILHYHLNQRTDSPLWTYCREMEVPDSLIQKIKLFGRRGYVDTYKYGLFALPSWLSVYVGQGLAPESVDPFAENFPIEQVKSRLDQLNASISKRVRLAPSHDDFLADYCPAVGV